MRSIDGFKVPSLLLTGRAILGCPLVRADFGVVTDERHHFVDTGAGLVFRVGKERGGIEPIQWRGMEL